MAFAFVAAVMSFVGSTTAPAQTVVRVQIGTPPPPMVVEHPWGRPYPGAVWVGGHHEWINGRWVWVGGYYSYPPRRGGYWSAPRYRGGYYYPGHWSYR